MSNCLLQTVVNVKWLNLDMAIRCSGNSSLQVSMAAAPPGNSISTLVGRNFLLRDASSRKLIVNNSVASSEIDNVFEDLGFVLCLQLQV